MKKVLIISNPLAGDGRLQPLLDGARILDAKFERISINAESRAAVEEALRKATPSNTAAVVIFGGDGTVHRCLEALIQTAIPVAVFPAGTVNDLALELGMTANWNELSDLLTQSREAALRLLEVNGRPFAVYGALGLGAETSRHQQRFRARLKALRLAFPTILAPLLTLFTALFTTGITRRLRLFQDGTTRDLLTAGIYIFNQSRVNRSIDLEWDKTADPARFRMVIFKNMGRLRLLHTVIRLSTERRLSAIRENVEVLDVDRVAIEALDGSPLHFVGDGEPMTQAKHLSVGFSAKPLLVFRGASS